MCSIMCYVGTLTEKESEAFLPKFTEGFEKTKSRGPDMSEVLQFGSGVCAFHRLVIMDLDATVLFGWKLFHLQRRIVWISQNET